MSVKLLVKYLPRERVAVLPTNRTECGEFNPPTSRGFYPEEDPLSYYEEKNNYIEEIEEELQLPPMELERVIGRLAILRPLSQRPPSGATDTTAVLCLPDEIPF